MQKRIFTPEKAMATLKAMGPNRNPAANVVASYARAMLEGRWEVNPLLALRFDAQGRLLDGQHRMLAVIEAGIPVEFHVDITDSTTLDLMHECRTRSLAHRVAISGACNTGHAGLYASLGAVLYDRMRGGVRVSATRETLGSTKRSLAEIQRGYEWAALESEHDLFCATFRMYEKQPRRFKLLNPTAIAYMIAQIGVQAEDYLEHIVSDEHQSRCTSAVTFRRQAMNQRYSYSERLCLVSLGYNNQTSKVLRTTEIVPDLIGSKFNS